MRSIFQYSCNRGWLDGVAVPIGMNNIKCDEDDEKITDCNYTLIMPISWSCDHGKDVALQCKGKQRKIHKSPVTCDNGRYF